MVVPNNLYGSLDVPDPSNSISLFKLITGLTPWALVVLENLLNTPLVSTPNNTALTVPLSLK